MNGSFFINKYFVKLSSNQTINSSVGLISTMTTGNHHYQKKKLLDKAMPFIKSTRSRNYHSETTEQRLESKKNCANIAVVGGGRMGLIRIKGIMSHGNANLAYIVDEDETTARQLGTQYGVRFTTKIETILEDRNVDGVWLSTPTDQHISQIEQVAKSGKAIGVEKPISQNTEEILASYDIAKKNNVKLFCSFQRRFDPSYVAVRNAIHNGKIGKIQSIHAVFRDHPMPSIEFLRRGGDPFHDLAVHDIDYVCHLLQEYPTEVIASGKCFIPELKECDVMDKATVVLYFDSGIVCTMDLSRGSCYGYDQRIEIFGNKGMLQVGNLPATSKIAYSTEGISSDRLMTSFPERFQEAYLEELNHFIEMIQGNTEPFTKCDEVCMATSISEACRLSSISNKKVMIQRNASSGAVSFSYK